MSWGLSTIPDALLRRVYAQNTLFRKAPSVAESSSSDNRTASRVIAGGVPSARIGVIDGGRSYELFGFAIDFTMMVCRRAQSEGKKMTALSVLLILY